MFERKPEYCPYGHQLWPDQCQVSLQPCVCEPAREAAGRGRGMGHVRVSCNRCHDELRQTVFYEPPHDARHSPLTGRTSSPLRRPLLVARRRQAGHADSGSRACRETGWLKLSTLEGSTGRPMQTSTSQDQPHPTRSVEVATSWIIGRCYTTE